VAMTLEEMLTRRDFVASPDTSQYAGEFKERELAELLAGRASLVGPGGGQAISGPTGLYGRALKAAGEREGSRAAAVGALSSRARSLRDKEFAQAAFQQDLEAAAAERAAKEAQHALKMQVLSGVGSVAQEVIGAIPAIGGLVADDVEQQAAVRAEDAALRQKTMKQDVLNAEMAANMELGRIAAAERGLAAEGLQIPGIGEAPGGGTPRFRIPGYESILAGPKLGRTPRSVREKSLEQHFGLGLGFPEQPVAVSNDLTYQSMLARPSLLERGEAQNLAWRGRGADPVREFD